METDTTQNQTTIALNIPAFWKAQRKDWRITVIRTSLERLGYKIILPYLTLYIILLGATKTQLGFVTSLGLIASGLIGPYICLLYTSIRFLVIPLAEKQGNPAIYSLWLRFMNISQIIPQMEQHILSKIKGLESNLGLYLF